MDKLLLVEIVGLERLSLKELRRRWQELFGREPPQYGRRFLVERLSYRLQELQYGGLSAENRRRMEILLVEREGKRGKKSARRLRGADGGQMIAGTRIIKEWRGCRHDVTVLERGYQYEGREYRSLSAIAQEITGSHWNGRAFFAVGPKKGSRLEA